MYSRIHPIPAPTPPINVLATALWIKLIFKSSILFVKFILDIIVYVKNTNKSASIVVWRIRVLKMIQRPFLCVKYYFEMHSTRRKFNVQTRA